MAASYTELNPQSVLRDALLDPLPEITAMGLAYQEIFKVPDQEILPAAPSPRSEKKLLLLTS